VGIEVLPASGRWDDFASFMVPRKPGGRGCVCIAYRNSSLDMPGRIAHMRSLCEREPGPGVLAYVDGEVAGWCSVAPKSTYRALVNSRTIPHVQDEGAWSVACFVVRPGFRRRGLMHQLLPSPLGPCPRGTSSPGTHGPAATRPAPAGSTNAHGWRGMPKSPCSASQMRLPY
jgi:hypothetical protein